MIRGPYEWFCTAVLAGVIVAIVVTVIFVIYPIVCYLKPGCVL
jgi:hypothetical protein